MLGLGLPERPGGDDLGDHLARPQSRGVHVGDRVLGDPALLLVGVEDRRPVAGADVVALAVLRRRIVDLEEELEQVAERLPLGVEDDLDRLGVGAVVAVGRVGDVTAGVAHSGRDHAWPLADQVLHTPEATSGKHGPFGGLTHDRLLLVRPGDDAIDGTYRRGGRAEVGHGPTEPAVRVASPSALHVSSDPAST